MPGPVLGATLAIAPTPAAADAGLRAMAAFTTEMATFSWSADDAAATKPAALIGNSAELTALRTVLSESVASAPDAAFPQRSPVKINEKASFFKFCIFIRNSATTIDSCLQ